MIFMVVAMKSREVSHLLTKLTTCSQEAEFRAAVDANVVEKHSRQTTQFLSACLLLQVQRFEQSKDFLWNESPKDWLIKYPKLPPFSHFLNFLKTFNAHSMQILQRVGFIFHLRSNSAPKEINFHLSPE